MKVSFVPELPPGDEWREVRSNITRELSHLHGMYEEFPSDLVIQLEAIPWSATGIALTRDGVRIAEIKYELLAPHSATYKYVGASKPIELPDDADA